MFEKKAMENTIGLVQDAASKGAKVLTGGKRDSRFDKGYFFEPTILAGLNDSCKVMTEEPFAPVMPVLDFSKLDEVIAAANNTVYGLAAYVFTNDLTVMWKMAEGLEAGIIGMNDPVPATPQCPFGGMKESGLVRELAHEGLEAYLETKYVSIKLREQPGWVTFNRAGTVAISSTGEVINTRTKKIVATLTDEEGREVHSEKVIEVVLENGAVVAVGDQFGLGRRGVRE